MAHAGSLCGSRRRLQARGQAVLSVVGEMANHLRIDPKFVLIWACASGAGCDVSDDD